jgi:hypothetical protein
MKRENKERSMKSRKIHFLFFILLLLLTACAGGVQAEPNTDASANVQLGTNGGSGTVLNMDYENALPVNLQLVLGTFELEDTEDAVTAEKAAELLPLWKAARSLSESETVAAEEMAALFDQIQDTMTPEQLSAIAAMQLTREDVAAIAEEQGLELGSGGGGFDFENLSPDQQATLQALRESGQRPGGGGPGGGGFIPGGGGPGGGGPGGDRPGGGFPGGFQNLSPEERATAIAERGGRFGGGAGVNPAFFDEIIAFLEGKIQ